MVLQSARGGCDMLVPGLRPALGGQPTPPMGIACRGRRADKDASAHRAFLTVPLCLGHFHSPPSCPKCVGKAIPPTSKLILTTTGPQLPRCLPKSWKCSRISEAASPPLEGMSVYLVI